VTPALLAALVLLQGNRLEASASVDRTRLPVGQQVTLTIRVRTQSAEAPRIELPSLPGFTVQGSREATQVSLGGAEGMTRAIVRSLSLRAEHPGVLVIGPVRVSVSGRSAATSPITIFVDSTSAYPGMTLGPLARSLLAGARPPGRGDQVALTVIFSADSVLVGQQLDVVLAAWFPRTLRERLRRPPLLTLPTPEDVWAYPPATPNGVVLSRQVRGQWMDLYAVHQVLFPLTAGRVTVPPGAVEYAVPVNFSFFSTEDRYSLTSDSVGVRVLGLPSARRLAGDQGVVATNLRLGISIAPSDARVGEPLEAVATLVGTGNVSLWPPPEIRWPTGFRAYPEETLVELTSTSGLIGGTKTFRYLVVADSAGSFLQPAVRYPYFDPSANAYRVIDIAPRSLVAAPGAEPRAARAEPPLLQPSGSGWLDRVMVWFSPWGWVACALLPPLLVGAARRRRRPAPAAPVPTTELTPLGRLEREFVTLLAAHVPDAATRNARSLSRALRAAGVDRAVADHVARLRDRLRAARYGPRGAGNPLDLAGELTTVLRVLEADGQTGRGRRRRVSVGLAVLAGAVVVGGQARAQGTNAEALYRAGALRAAADSFAARAGQDTLDAAHWYDLGATLYRSGADGKAVVAFVRAQRLAPRNRIIRRTRALLPAPDAITEGLLTVGPATPAEWAVLAAVWWIACWVVVWRRRFRSLAFGFGVLAVASAWLGVGERARRDRDVAVVVTTGTPVRVAPYGQASAPVTLGPGEAVVVVDQFAGGHWLRVRRPDGINGWVQSGQVARL
jgi:BatD DUF11 like domain